MRDKQYKTGDIRRDIHISIVSHNHEDMIHALLRNMADFPSSSRMQFTIVLNVPGSSFLLPESLPFPVSILKNQVQKGFSENHNRAFRQPPIAKERKYFAVLNPDVRLQSEVFIPLIERLELDQNIGVVAPQVQNMHAMLEDSARELPTTWRLILKVFGRRGAWKYSTGEGEIQPDWIAGMFMLFRAHVFHSLGGFDERYFLYYEDVDICSRIWLEGFSVQLYPHLFIIHDGQRKSWRNIQFLRWHLASMRQFLSSSTYQRARHLHANR